MGIYTDDVVKKTSAEASNTGAVTNAIGNVATTLASVGAIAGGGAMARLGSKAGASAGALKTAQFGKDIQKMGFQMIGRNVGGFSGIVIASNIADAYQSYNYKEDIDNAIKSNNEIERQARKISTMPMNAVRKQFSQAGQELRRRKKGEGENGR